MAKRSKKTSLHLQITLANKGPHSTHLHTQNYLPFEKAIIIDLVMLSRPRLIGPQSAHHLLYWGLLFHKIWRRSLVFCTSPSLVICPSYTDRKITKKPDHNARQLHFFFSKLQPIWGCLNFLLHVLMNMPAGHSLSMLNIQAKKVMKHSIRFFKNRAILQG